jgi:hypothetical protein
MRSYLSSRSCPYKVLHLFPIFSVKFKSYMSKRFEYAVIKSKTTSYEFWCFKLLTLNKSEMLLFGPSTSSFTDKVRLCDFLVSSSVSQILRLWCLVIILTCCGRHIISSEAVVTVYSTSSTLSIPSIFTLFYLACVGIGIIQHFFIEELLMRWKLREDRLYVVLCFFTDFLRRKAMWDSRELMMWILRCNWVMLRLIQIFQSTTDDKGTHIIFLGATATSWFRRNDCQLISCLNLMLLGTWMILQIMNFSHWQMILRILWIIKLLIESVSGNWELGQ